MSADKATNPCNKFEANIFNKSKCQNCFKSRELHLMTDNEMEQAKPVYGGWLCLAPEGTDFDNPAQKSRKWQRRFFILYENGNLSFALDELMSTLPQGTVDVNTCTSVADAEPRTGQRNALCIATAQQDLFIRGESREMINGWCEQIAVIQRNNKHSCSRKHKVDHDPTQEACPAKMAAAGSCLLEVEGDGGRPAEPGAGLRKDAQLGGGLSWTGTDMDPLGPSQHSSGNRLQCHTATTRGRSSSAGTEIKPATRWRGTASASPKRDRPANDRRSDKADHLETGYPTATDTKLEGDQSESRMDRSQARVSKREKSTCSRSRGRGPSDSIKTPDLLNFKKGWMVKLEKEDQWRKYWFVLSADSLRYYKDSIAEEAFDLQGEIDLTKCYDVSEYKVLRNYGFQIHTRRGVYTLSAMTAGIRKNWIQALMKNVVPAHAPDALAKPDVTRDSPSKVPTEGAPHLKDPTKTLQERRRDEDCKTSSLRLSDRTEFSPLSESSSAMEIRSGEPLDQERRRRRQRRRKRYESILGFALSREMAGDEGEGGREDPRGGTSGSQKVLVEEGDMEKIWMQVERTALRADRVVPLFTETADEDTVELQRLMETYRQGVRDASGGFKAEVARLSTELEEEKLREKIPDEVRFLQVSEGTGTASRAQGKLMEAACERGLASMEESQQRVLEGIQLHHQGELERLMTDRDQLLEEETAATVMAIGSMKRAYQRQLDRQAEKTHQSQLSADNTHLQRRYSCSAVQEELEVLAQHYSLQRQENSHLGRALDAERTALCQCRQENRDLHARNQELSGLLAAELSRLCCRSQQEASPLHQGANVFELEISLRVKEWEIQGLRREVSSLKEDLLHAHTERSLAVQQQTEISTELTRLKVRFQRDMDVLQENLRLAHRALEQTIP
ncbi:unnamed protein product [Lota lota]